MLAVVDKRPSDLPVIGVDLDSTIATYDTHALQVMQAASSEPERCVLENWKSWDLQTCFGEEACTALVAAMNTPGFWLNLDTITGAGKSLAKLMRHHRVHIITTRPPEFAELTKIWLCLYEVPFDDLTVVNHRKEKLDVALDAQCVAFVDDNQETAETMRDAGLVVGQLAWPWNSGGDGIIRCEDWPGLSLALAQEIKLKLSDFRLF
jgi:5'(3')-deoxyribonucleotidase